MTRKGVEHDLLKSPYIAYYGDLKFYFSSLLYKTNFRKKVNDYVSKYSMYFNKKFKLNVNAEYFLAISLYKIIEKRGFKVENTLTNEFVNSGKTYEVR